MISYLCFLFPELVWPFKKTPIHAPPIQLINVHFYESSLIRGEAVPLEPGKYEVGTDNEYEHVIGIVLFRQLCPFLVPRAGLQNTYERVKLRIIEEKANVTVPISRNDPLNRLFFEKFGPAFIVPGLKR